MALKQPPYSNKSSGYLFPIDAIRDYMNANPVQAYTSDVVQKPFPLKLNKPVKASSGNPDQLINRVRAFYNGSISFDAWLSLPSTKCNMLSALERLLLHQSGMRKDFLPEIGLDPSEQMTGYYIGKMHCAYPLVRLKEMRMTYFYKKYPRHLFDQDERWLQLFLRMRHPWNENLPVIHILSKCNNAQEMIRDIFKHYYGYLNTARINQYFQICLVRNAYKDLNQMMFFKNLSPLQLAGYCTGAIHYFNAGGEDFINQMNKGGFQRLAKICDFYCTLIQLDYEFVKGHFPISLEIFLGQRPFNQTRVKNLFIKHTIYKSSRKRKTFTDLLQRLSQFEQKLDIILDLKPTPLSKLYHELPYHDRMWAFRRIGNFLEIHEDDGQ